MSVIITAIKLNVEFQIIWEFVKIDSEVTSQAINQPRKTSANENTTLLLYIM